ncbi:MAG TPA: YidB family protein [Usitatibacter sp.]|nr:YidB family protein [Usitatibacter sp.]
MSLFDTFRSALGGTGNDSLGGLASHALGLLQQHPGGLNGLLDQFNQAGLGDAVKSWIGTGANHPISADDIQRVLGSDVVKNLAARAGLSHSDAASQLAAVLPQLVDKLSPGGQLPQGELLQQAVAMIRGKLAG